MAKRISFEPSQLIEMQKRIDLAIKSSNQAHLLITIAILNDIYEWNAEDINGFLDRYEEFLASYEKGEEDINVLNRNIYEVTGIAIMEIRE